MKKEIQEFSNYVPGLQSAALGKSWKNLMLPRWRCAPKTSAL